MVSLLFANKRCCYVLIEVGATPATFHADNGAMISLLVHGLLHGLRAAAYKQLWETGEKNIPYERL